MAGDERGARAMAVRTPDLLVRAPKDLVHKAVGTKRKAAVKLVLDLGFDPNWQEDNAAIHEAGVLDENEEILRILLAHGASLTLRDPWYDGTAVGWAEFFDFPRLRDRLLNEGAICLFDALDHDRLDRVADILARSGCAEPAICRVHLPQTQTGGLPNTPCEDGRARQDRGCADIARSRR